jgi:Domain of unknown function (DUF4167)
MRNGQNNKRMRGRNNNQHHHHRKNQNPLTRVYESNGPDVKIRGTASHVAEKYVQLARDAMASSDPVIAENYHQHAEHYFRLIAAAQEQFRQQNPYHRPEGEAPADNRDESFDDGEDGTEHPAQGQPSFGNQQPYPPRDAQPYPNRDPHQQHGGRDQHQHQQPRPQQQQHQSHQHNPQQTQQHQPSPQPSGAEGSDADRLPSFITGTQPQQNSGQNGYDNQGGDRYQMHRRRRRHRGHHRQDGPGGAQGPNRGDAPPDNFGNE